MLFSWTLPSGKQTHKSISVEEDTYCYLFLRCSLSLSWLLAAIHSTSCLLACLLESSSPSPPPPLLPQMQQIFREEEDGQIFLSNFFLGLKSWAEILLYTLSIRMHAIPLSQLCAWNFEQIHCCIFQDVIFFVTMVCLKSWADCCITYHTHQELMMDAVSQ